MIALNSATCHLLIRNWVFPQEQNQMLTWTDRCTPKLTLSTKVNIRSFGKD